jgi:hypothetical protein
MAEFVSLARWLREPVPLDEPPAVIVEPRALESRPETVEASAPQDELIDDVCARIRRFRAMLDDAFDYVQERGEPKAPLTVRVHTARMAEAKGIGFPLVADMQLREEDAVIELRCGSLDARLRVPLCDLLAENPPR